MFEDSSGTAARFNETERNYSVGVCKLAQTNYLFVFFAADCLTSNKTLLMMPLTVKNQLRFTVRANNILNKLGNCAHGIKSEAGQKCQERVEILSSAP